MFCNQEPYVIQGSAAPAFRMPGEAGSLVCGCQGSVLVEGYRPENFVSVRIKCFVCGQITSTPGLPPGEILPSRIVTLGADGRFLLSSTLEMREHVVVTCDKEIEFEQSSTRPRKPADENISIDLNLIDQVEAEFGRIIGARALEHQCSAVRRAMKHGHSGADEFPLAWGCLWLRNWLAQEAGGWRLDAPFMAATTYLLAFRHFAAAWGHHPRFATISQSFAGGRFFHHNIAQFAAASYMIEHGNRVGLAIPEGGSQRTADLYTRTAPGEVLHIETKAPQALQWPNAILGDRHAIGQVVLKALKTAKGQLNRKKKGILVVAANVNVPHFDQQLHAGIRSAIHAKGRDHRGVAAVVGIVPTITVAGSPLKLAHGYTFVPILNPHFDGENPVLTGEQDAGRSGQPP
jgi:hypothetical protein